MPISFIDLAQTCAPFVASETLAGVVSLESRFAPFNIRINSGASPKSQLATKAEAIELATALAAERQDVQLGLGGIGLDELRRLNLSISDAFDPCLNLKATATLLDGYYRLATKEGAAPARAEQIMLQSYYGRDDPSVGAMVNYDEQVRREIKRLGPTIARLTISDDGEGRGDDSPTGLPPADVVAEVVAENSSKEPATVSVAPTWDVFQTRRRSSVLVFQSSQGELEMQPEARSCQCRVNFPQKCRSKIPQLCRRGRQGDLRIFRWPTAWLLRWSERRGCDEGLGSDMLRHKLGMLPQPIA